MINKVENLTREIFFEMFVFFIEIKVLLIEAINKTLN